MRVLEALDRFLVQLDADGRSPHTRGQIQRHLRMFARWCESNGKPDDVAALTSDDLAQFLASDAVRLTVDGKRRMPASGNAIRSSVRVFFAYCAAAGIAPANVAQLVRRARVGPSAPNGLRDDERDAIMAAMRADESVAAKRDLALFTVLATTGLRIGSALALDVTDVDCDRCELLIRTLKKGGTDVAFMPEVTAQLLREFIGDRVDGPLFVGAHGRRVGARHFARRLSEWAKRAGLRRRVHPHMARHGFAMALYESTADIGLVSRALCHRSLASTVTYARVSPTRLHAAVEGLART